MKKILSQYEKEDTVKKSRVFEVDEIKKYLEEAPDDDDIVKNHS
jgi:hypothetical protein